MPAHAKIVIVITSYRTQTQSAKIIAQQELMKKKQVTGNVKTV